MRIIAILLLAVSLASCATSPRPPSVEGLEATRSLGHGFWLVVVAKHLEGGFESIGHFGHCYYNNQDLGRCDRMSPSPTGRYAIYQQASSGLVMFFDTRTGRSTQIMATSAGLLGPATWDEAGRSVGFKVGETGAEQTITFPFGGVVDGT